MNYRAIKEAFDWWCWLLGCKIVCGWDGSEWCTRCGGDKPFFEGPAWARK